MSPTSSKEGEVGESTVYGRLLAALMTLSFKKAGADEFTIHLKDWKKQIMDALLNAYEEALEKKHPNLSQYLAEWGGHLFQLDSGGSNFLRLCAIAGDEQDLHDLVDQGVDLDWHDSRGWTALHYAADRSNLAVVIALVEQKPSLMYATADYMYVSAWTPLDVAVGCCSQDVVAYLLDHGAKSISHNALFHAVVDFFITDIQLNNIEYLLDIGWDRTVRDDDGQTLLDVARSKGNVTLVDHLEHYQTVRLPPYGTTPYTVDEEAF
ncbi:hypothetical protein C0992_000326 [Termitomyces sp. T32_za158]|nr:hypothetical protein C0992_000326 [Termitomyces sp. T32_za158]